MRCQYDDCTNETAVEYQPIEAGDTETIFGQNWSKDKWVPMCDEHLKNKRMYWLRHPDGRQEMVRPRSK